ncbi:MAG: ribosomal protein S18-alanine N-acetyltransferase [Deltaproteobacteria bacterium]|nr:ribosomal protein S18-alanine N-acetyltransferase [Deltaproteobacteria bacterium]
MTSLVSVTAENARFYLPQVYEIEKLSFPSPWSLNALQSEIKNPVSHLWVFKKEEILSGYICFWMFDEEAQVLSLAVHPHDRGKGIGHYLLKKMIEKAVSKGVQYIWLEVRPSNLAGKSLYEKLGFIEVYRRPRYYSNTEDAIVMGLSPIAEETDYRI